MLFYAILIVLLSSAHCTPPHVLLVVVDDLGWSDVGFHNITSIQTPNIDRLAYEGVILNNYYVQPICSPTRSALLSGRYPIHTGLQHGVIRPEEPYGLPLTLELLPQMMKKAGYATHMVGKWHLGFFEWQYTPTYRGFDTFYGFYVGAEDHWTHEREGILDLRDQTTPVKDMNNMYSAEIFSKRAEEIILAHNSSAPLFLYLPFQNVHAPTQAPERFVNKYKYIKDMKRRTYAGMVSAVDEAIGNVTNAMKTKGLWENTLMIFTTDNGGIPIYGGYDWPLRGFKATLWEGGVRGAGFVHGEMIAKKNRICKELVHVTDWYPTLTALAGIEAPNPVPPLDGFNVWDTISAGKPSPRTEILHNIDMPSTTHFLAGYEGIALRVGDMKLMMNVPNLSWYKPPELEKGWRALDIKDAYEKEVSNDRIKMALYNITADPEERHDLSTSLPDVVSTLMKRVNFYMKGVVPSIKKAPDSKAKETAERNGYWGPWRTGIKYFD